MAYHLEFLPTPLPPQPPRHWSPPPHFSPGFWVLIHFWKVQVFVLQCWVSSPRLLMEGKSYPELYPNSSSSSLSCHFMYCLILLVDNFIKCILIIWTSPTPPTHFPTHLNCPKKKKNSSDTICPARYTLGCVVTTRATPSKDRLCLSQKLSTAIG